MSVETTRFHSELPPIPSSFNVKEVVVAGDRGPCGGVIRAIEATQNILDHVQRIKEQTGIEIPVYASHQIVHNEPISKEFASQGLIIEPDPDNVKPGSIYLLSAHGTKPSVIQALREKGVIACNLECQLVTADRTRAERTLANGRDLVYFETPGHPEPKAVTGDLPQERVHLIDSTKKAEEIELPSVPFDVLSQTTISRERVKKTVRRWGKLHNAEIPVFEKGPCPATDNRQDALRTIFSRSEPSVDLAITVTSGTSHNGEELRKIGKKARKGSIAVDSIDQLDTSLFTEDVERVALTSSASVLDRYTVPFLQLLQKGGARIRINFGKEKYGSFAPPKDLELVHGYLEQTYAIQ